VRRAHSFSAIRPLIGHRREQNQFALINELLAKIQSRDLIRVGELNDIINSTKFPAFENKLVSRRSAYGLIGSWPDNQNYLIS
jgi:hypothetical protein